MTDHALKTVTPREGARNIDWATDVIVGATAQSAAAPDVILTAAIRDKIVSYGVDGLLIAPVVSSVGGTVVDETGAEVHARTQVENRVYARIVELFADHFATTVILPLLQPTLDALRDEIIDFTLNYESVVMSTGGQVTTTAGAPIYARK